MAEIKLSTMEPVASTRQSIWLGRGVSDPSNPFADDVVVTGGTITFRSKTVAVNGDDASPDTATSKMIFVGRLTKAYDAGTNFDVEVAGHCSRAPGTSSTVDVQVWKLDANKQGSGSDLCTTAAQSNAETTATTKVFSVNGSSLSPGDFIAIIVERAINDTGAAGGSVDAFAYLDGVTLLGTMSGEFGIFE